MKRGAAIVFAFLLILACKKDDPKPPEAAALEFPLQNSECTTGVDVSETTSQVEFRWQAAKRTKSYELRVTHMISNVLQTATTETTAAKLTIEKGAPYSWMVISKSSNSQETASSNTWQFYNAGSQTTYPPFPAEASDPKSGSSKVRDINNEITLEWTAADIDDDIAGFEVYFGTVNPPTNLEASPVATITNLKVGVTSNTIYYWKIVTRDEEGNSSDSGVFSFKAL